MAAQIDQQTYFRLRAAAAREMGAAAATPQIASIHFQLALRYEIAAGASVSVVDPQMLTVSYEDFSDRPAQNRASAA